MCWTRNVNLYIRAIIEDVTRCISIKRSPSDYWKKVTTMSNYVFYGGFLIILYYYEIMAYLWYCVCIPQYRSLGLKNEKEFWKAVMWMNECLFAVTENKNTATLQYKNDKWLFWPGLAREQHVLIPRVTPNTLENMKSTGGTPVCPFHLFRTTGQSTI